MHHKSVLIFILVLEITMFIFLIKAIVCHRMFLFFTQRIKRKRAMIISAYFFDLMEHRRTFEAQLYPGRPSWHSDLLEFLETCNHRFQGDDWEQLKHAASQLYLLPKARQWARNVFWKKRSFASRSFALSPLSQDECHILKLMDDRKFLVRSTAALAAIRLESVEGVRKALLTMHQEPGYSHFFYRDLLVQGSNRVIAELIVCGSNPLLHETCLDVLSAKTWGLVIPFLQHDVEADDPTIRCLALRVLIKNPLPNSAEIFLQALQDPEEEVRIEATQGLANFPSLGHLDALEKALSDPSWLVQIGAARALKNLEAQGEQILRRQKTPPASLAVNYIEQFG